MRTSIRIAEREDTHHFFTHLQKFFNVRRVEHNQTSSITRQPMPSIMMIGQPHPPHPTLASSANWHPFAIVTMTPKKQQK